MGRTGAATARLESCVFYDAALCKKGNKETDAVGSTENWSVISTEANIHSQPC